MHAQVYSNAKSRSTKKFLEELLRQAPFPITSIQVDGGSEFRDEFEKACADYEIPLIVLPQASLNRMTASSGAIVSFVKRSMKRTCKPIL